MTDGAAELVPTIWRAVRVLAAATLMVVLVAGYFAVGWRRMEAACTAEPPGAPVVRSVELGWSWTPVGFQCTDDAGRQRTSLWF